MVPPRRPSRYDCVNSRRGKKFGEILLSNLFMLISFLVSPLSFFLFCYCSSCQHLSSKLHQSLSIHQFRNLIRGTTIENTYRSGEKFETALIEKMAHQFTYAEGVRKKKTPSPQCLSSFTHPPTHLLISLVFVVASMFGFCSLGFFFFFGF